MFTPATETRAHRVLALERRIRQLSAPPRPTNPWQSSFHRFLTEKVYTKDEERAGLVARMPDYPYFAEVCDALVERPKLFIEKSRRVMASWVVCAFDLWVAAGGIDPRWPSLTLSTRNRRVFIVAQSAEGPTGSQWFLRERVKFIYDELIERGVKEWWPEFPTFRFKTEEVLASNGSAITAVPEGPNKSRGGGVTLVHNEEFAFWEQAQDTLNVQLPCSKNGGHVIICTTPQVGSYAKDIRDGVLRRR